MFPPWLCSEFANSIKTCLGFPSYPLSRQHLYSARIWRSGPTFYFITIMRQQNSLSQRQSWKAKGHHKQQSSDFMTPKRCMGAAERAFLLGNMCFACIPHVKVTPRQSNGSSIFIATCLHLGDYPFPTDEQGGTSASFMMVKLCNQLLQVARVRSYSVTFQGLMKTSLCCWTA